MLDSISQINIISRLDEQIRVAKSSRIADCKRAERAIYYCRIGRLDEAISEIENLRTRYLKNPNAEVSSWVHLADGLIEYFSDMGPTTRVKILRSNALSSAANIIDMQALSAAWLAHIDYTQGNFESMAEFLRRAAPIWRSSTQAEARVSLVIAQCFHFIDQLDNAIPWYQRARVIAIKDGDEATISALMHNMAWLRSRRLRATDCGLEQIVTKDAEHALMGSDSTANFDSMIGATSLDTLVPILRAQTLTATGDFSAALDIFNENVEKSLKQGMKRLHSDFLADQAWCYFNTGSIESSLRLANAAEISLDRKGHHDDLALTCARLSQVFTHLGFKDRGQKNQEEARIAWNGHKQLQAEAEKQLGGVDLLQFNIYT